MYSNDNNIISYYRLISMYMNIILVITQTSVDNVCE